MTEQQLHAKYRPPSSAARWLSCPASAGVAYKYDNSESEASLNGTLAHNLLDMYLTFGVKPDTDDPDMDLNVIDAGDWAKQKRDDMGADLYVEQKLDIPATGEFGTSDIVLVSDSTLHIADYKNGYVPVDVVRNAQMLTYLSGAIAKYGEKKKYFVTVIQPNYNHIDGPIRTWEVTESDLEWFNSELKYSMTNAQTFAAGDHCKKTYCPHRGNCKTFTDWAKNNGADAWYPHEVNALNDEQLAEALDHADVLHGIRDELRKQAIVRIMQHGKEIPGYKCVKSRSQRDFAGDEGREACYKSLLEMGYEPNELVEKTPIQVGSATIHQQTILSVAGVERMVKQKYKSFGRGKWKGIWDDLMQPHIRDFSGSITLERAIDGRPGRGPGSEFDVIGTPTEVTKSENVTII